MLGTSHTHFFPYSLQTIGEINPVCRTIPSVYMYPGGASQVLERTHARPEKRVKGGVYFKTTRDARGAFRGAKTLFFRKRGVSNFSGVAIRVMFSVL